jgi:hypothetical protein
MRAKGVVTPDFSPQKGVSACRAAVPAGRHCGQRVPGMQITS